MGWMDLELCTGWLVPHSKLQAQVKKTCLWTVGLSSYAEWILSFVQEMGVRTGPQGSWFHQKSLPEFLDLWSIDLVPQKRWKIRTCFRTSAVFMTEWILSFVQEMGVRTGQQGSWFHQKSLPEFLDLWSIDWSHMPNCQHKRKKNCLETIGLSTYVEWTLNFVQEMGVRTGPQGSWFHQKSLSEFLDLWSIDWSHIQIASAR